MHSTLILYIDFVPLPQTSCYKLRKVSSKALNVKARHNVKDSTPLPLNVIMMVIFSHKYVVSTSPLKSSYQKFHVQKSCTLYYTLY